MALSFSLSPQSYLPSSVPPLIYLCLRGGTEEGETLESTFDPHWAEKCKRNDVQSMNLTHRPGEMASSALEMLLKGTLFTEKFPQARLTERGELFLQDCGPMSIILKLQVKIQNPNLGRSQGLERGKFGRSRAGSRQKLHSKCWFVSASHAKGP